MTGSRHVKMVHNSGGKEIKKKNALHNILCKHLQIAAVLKFSNNRF